jgi:hypothetical protein
MKNSHTQINYEKIREITQGPDESPSLFMACLTEAITMYTNLDLTTPMGTLFLPVQFISQSAPDI